MNDKKLNNVNGHFNIRFAKEEDVPIILAFTKELAEYEKLLNEVVATEELLYEWIFKKHKAEVLIAEYEKEPIGFALFFHNFSTFLGRAGIYLEDLYITPAMRGRGFGKMMLVQLAKLTIQRGAGRLEWVCLDWNQPSIDFYLSLNAKPMDGWTTYRMTGDALSELANNKPKGMKKL